MSCEEHPGEPKHLVLVNPATDSCEEAASATCFPPLGLLSLATVVRREVPDVMVRVVDEAVAGSEGVLAMLRPGCVVGISALTTTYRNALKIADAAAEQRCFVVMGNDHASRFARMIVRKRPVDAVIVGDHAEFPFARLIRWLANPRDCAPPIPGLVINTRGGLLECPPTRYPMAALPVVDRSLVDHSPYCRNFRRRFPKLPRVEQRTPTTVNFCRGCAKAKNRCTFCDIHDLSLDRVQPVRFWHEVAHLASMGLDYLWEVGDSFTSHGPWLRALAQANPGNLEVEFFVYARAAELVRPGLISTLRQIGVTRVNVGMESGDDAALRILNKGNPTGAYTNTEAARILKDHGVRLHVSLVLGAPGETEDSLRRTEELVEKLLDLDILTSVDVAILHPLPGAPIWRLVEETVGFEDACGTDLLPADLSQRFARAFTKVSWERLQATRARIYDMVLANGLVAGGFG